MENGPAPNNHSSEGGDVHRRLSWSADDLQPGRVGGGGYRQNAGVTRLSFAQLNERANRLANALRAAGVDKGDRVAMLALDGVEHLDLLCACGSWARFTPP